MEENRGRQQKPRGKRTNNQQMCVMLDFFAGNRTLITGRTHPLAVNEVEESWGRLTEHLNEVENGARKDTKGWKSFFTEWKCKTRKKARISKKEIKGTGGGSVVFGNLTDIENRLMALTGIVSATGCEDLPDEIDPEATTLPIPARLSGLDEEVVEEVGETGNFTTDEAGFLQTISYENFQTEDDIEEQELEEKLPVNAATSRGRKRPGDNQRPNIPKRRRCLQTKSGQSQLKAAAELYEESTKAVLAGMTSMSLSFDNMANAMKELAAAIRENTASKSILL